jgi:hypothetical protein
VSWSDALGIGQHGNHDGGCIVLAGALAWMGGVGAGVGWVQRQAQWPPGVTRAGGLDSTAWCCICSTHPA